VKRLIFVLFLCPSVFWAQVFRLEAGGLRMYADTSFATPLGDAGYELCWCDVIYNADSTEIKYLLPQNEDKGRVLVKSSGGWGILDKKGVVKEACTSPDPYTYDALGVKVHFRNFGVKDYSPVGNKESYLQQVDSTGKELKKIFVRADYKGHFLASPDNVNWGIVNGNMRTLLKMQYDPARYQYTNFFFSPGGLIPLETKGAENRYGIVNYKGEITAAFRYTFMTDYIRDENCIYVEIQGKKGYINKFGAVVFPIIHEKLPMYMTDSNLVATENYIWFMDENFKQIRDLRFQKLEKEGDVYFFKRNDLWGVMDLKLNVIIKNQYYSIVDGPRMKENPDFKTYVVVKAGKYGVLDKQGNVIIPCSYNCRCSLGYFSPAGAFIELSDGNKVYKFNEKGEVLSTAPAAGKACLCESYE
jgi:hypothetical protein